MRKSSSIFFILNRVDDALTMMYNNVKQQKEK